MLYLSELSTGYAIFTPEATLKSFIPFKSAAHALENINDVSESICNNLLKDFIQLNCKGIKLGVFNKEFAGAVRIATGVECVCDDEVLEVLRAIRAIQDKADVGDLSRAQLGLGHAYSRTKVKFNINRADNMIIQAICLLDQLDKDVNTFSMRIKEWYGWHFPELVRIVDGSEYATLVGLIGDKATLTQDSLDALTEFTSPEKAQQIINAAKSSMGTDISPIDLINILSFSTRVKSLVLYRKNLYAYLCEKMSIVAPNLSALIGEIVGARLISHAGSLTNLAKYPASTVQILGAEKALFRALKTKGNTPKYGLIYHSSFIGRAGLKNKGRISRFLANKCSIASRIDFFVDVPTSKFGEMLKEQVEERLKFYEDGVQPRSNEVVMKLALSNLKRSGEEVEDEKVVKKSKKEKKVVAVVEEVQVEAKKEKKKKSKKEQVEEEEVVAVEAKKEKKKKSKKSE